MAGLSPPIFLLFRRHSRSLVEGHLAGLELRLGGNMPPAPRKAMTSHGTVIMRTLDIASIPGELDSALLADQDLLFKAVVILRLDAPGILVPGNDGINRRFYDVHA